MAEVRVTVTDEDRGAVGAGWRYLLLAVAALALGAVLTVTGLGSGRGRGPSSTTPISSSPARTHRGQVSSGVASSRCVDAAGYGGLGGRASAFDADNNNSTGPAEPTPGPAWYVVTATARGCITAFSLQDEGSPPLTARDLLFLVSHPYLPPDARRIVSADTCAVWKSGSLRRATGRAYAMATAVGQRRSSPGRAEIGVTSLPDCSTLLRR